LEWIAFRMQSYNTGLWAARGGQYMLQTQAADYLLGRESQGQYALVAGFMPLDHLNLAFAKAQGFGQELDQGLVGRAFHRRGGKPHLERAVFHFFDLIAGSAGRNFDRKADPFFFLLYIQQGREL
jgi:hypothetical protein